MSNPSSLPLMAYETVHRFPVEVTIMPLESFCFNGANYAGVQPSAWESSERAWDSDNYGRWIGPGAIHVRPGALNVAPLDESTVALEEAGHDEQARVTDVPEGGALLRASWTQHSPSALKEKPAHVHLILQDAATGATLNEQTIEATLDHLDLPPLSAHAVLWARFDDVQKDWSPPPDYLQVRGFTSIPDKFKYQEAGSAYVWDYEADVGRRPTDLSHPFYAAYQTAFLNGTLLHRGAWTQYITDGSVGGGPWSALRIAVGEEDFAIGADFQPATGPVLYELTGESTRSALLINPLALSVSASYVLQFGDNAGKCRIGGTIAGRSGPLTAYWDFHPTAAIDNLFATLLGTSALNFIEVCEASLYPVVSDVLELPLTDGETVSRELILSHSHLYEYTPDAPTIPLRLPGIPAVTKGHPGGRCLRFADGEVRFFTEFFGGIFYNTLRTLDASQNVGVQTGTVFHGDNCAEVCWNDYYGWVQDKSFGSPDARQYLAFIRNGGNSGHIWDKSSMAAFSAATHHWQRLRKVNNGQRMILVASGKRATSEEPLWAVCDGTQFKEAWLPFRARRLTRCTDEDGTEWLYLLGRFVEEDEDEKYSIVPQWSVIRLRGTVQTVHACWNDEVGESGGFCIDRSEAEALGVVVEDLPPFLRWIAVGGIAAGGYWLSSNTEPDEPYLTLDVGAESLCWLLSGTLPYNVLFWPCIEFEVGSNDTPAYPTPECESAQCVKDQDPENIVAIIEQKAISSEMWTAAQVCDVNDLGEDGVRLLRKQGELFPNLWGRVNSDATSDDLSSYTIPLVWDAFVSLPIEAREKIEVVALCLADSLPLRGPVIMRRN